MANGFEADRPTSSQYLPNIPVKPCEELIGSTSGTRLHFWTPPPVTRVFIHQPYPLRPSSFTDVALGSRGPLFICTETVHDLFVSALSNLQRRTKSLFRPTNRSSRRSSDRPPSHKVATSPTSDLAIMILDAEMWETEPVGRNLNNDVLGGRSCQGRHA
ncbi:hypothetical protein M407DRAFT_23481 [Tulasnella calospora MUT 4182]|uniref:Uncharacterized protein n=1 Tax=Tulasnella calospora MUT 4182 TaxID=1051891 RepID=A0A0C3QJL1_9AGAM|nr:hypothetical protein M407DRAFT_23481 [Tulasnella calospora MUT 4182]